MLVHAFGCMSLTSSALSLSVHPFRMPTRFVNDSASVHLTRPKPFPDHLEELELFTQSFASRARRRVHPARVPTRCRWPTRGHVWILILRSSAGARRQHAQEYSLSTNVCGMRNHHNRTLAFHDPRWFRQRLNRQISGLFRRLELSLADRRPYAIHLIKKMPRRFLPTPGLEPRQSAVSRRRPTNSASLYGLVIFNDQLSWRSFRRLA